MKIKSLIWTLGIKPKPRRYGTRKLKFTLPKDGSLEYAKWLHPKDYFSPFKQDQVDEFRQWVKEGDTVIDIGAHSGDFSLPMALAAGKTGCVFAFEPNPYVFEVLRENASLNTSKTNIIAVQAAASSTNGVATFQYSDPGFCNGGQLSGWSRWKHGHPFSLDVPTLRVQDWIRDHHPNRWNKISLLKVDTEGNDLDVLMSLENLIEDVRPVIHAEMFRHLSEEQRRALWNFLTAKGYDVFTADGHYGATPAQRLQASELMREPHFDIIALPQK